VKFRVLVVDDEPSITRSLGRVLTDRGYSVEAAASGSEGLTKMEHFRPHIVLLDVRLPDTSGFDLIPRLHKVESGVQVIVITAFGDTKAAVRAMKLGATDFLRKPYDLDELFLAVDTASRTFSRDAQLTVYRRKDRGLYNPDEILWRSEVMGKVWELVRKVARSDATGVLITGRVEPARRSWPVGSTSRGPPARAFHGDQLLRLPGDPPGERALRSRAGAFTGASYLKRGLVELSDGGTLFLDEVGEMQLSTQAKLLRFLEDRCFRRVGGTSTSGSTCASCRDQRGHCPADRGGEVPQGSLLPAPGRVDPSAASARAGDDVNLLAEFFLRRFSGELRKAFSTLDDDVRQVFRSYPWPGNVRELRNLIERIVLIEDGEILSLRHLPREMIVEAKSEAGDLRRARKNGVVPQRTTAPTVPAPRRCAACGRWRRNISSGAQLLSGKQEPRGAHPRPLAPGIARSAEAPSHPLRSGVIVNYFGHVKFVYTPPCF